MLANRLFCRFDSSYTAPQGFTRPQARSAEHKPWRSFLRAGQMAAVLAGLTWGVNTAGASVLGITVNDASNGDYTLTSVTVDRGAAGTFNYTPSQLIGVDLANVAATGSVLLVPSMESVPAAGTRASLLEDMRLNTGIINPFSTGAPADQAFQVNFLTPVVNSTGADIIVFEIGAGDSTAFWVNGDRDNLRHNVAAADFSAALLTEMPHTLYRHDGNVVGLDTLETSTSWSLDNHFTGNVVAIGLDLSDFGIAEGASVTSLHWQTTSISSRLDAVLVAGLPAVPEPASLTLLGVAGACLLGRRRVVG
ncbi:MAG TPA: PEP-CTERM sorting domain-containing protein [Phycisphaeraceae bacterium]